MSILYCWMSIRADMKSFAEQTWKATAHSWNMQVVHALRTLFWSCLPREFVALSPILNIYCRPSELLFIYFFIFTTVLSILLREYSCQKRNPYVTVHPHDESGAASLRYRYRAAIIVLRCEQKTFPVWFSWWCKRSQRRHFRLPWVSSLKNAFSCSLYCSSKISVLHLATNCSSIIYVVSLLLIPGYSYFLFTYLHGFVCTVMYPQQ